MGLIHWGGDMPLAFVKLWKVVCKSRGRNLNADVWRQRSPLRTLEVGLDLQGGKCHTDYRCLAVIYILDYLCAALHTWSAILSRRARAAVHDIPSDGCVDQADKKRAEMYYAYLANNSDQSSHFTYSSKLVTRPSTPTSLR